jgi:hypothetical protein
MLELAKMAFTLWPIGNFDRKRTSMVRESLVVQHLMIGRTSPKRNSQAFEVVPGQLQSAGCDSPLLTRGVLLHIRPNIEHRCGFAGFRGLV